MFKHQKILITGGLGFIGSNLAIRLIGQGAEVTLLDSMIPEYGGNLHNIEPIKDKVQINYCDITDINAMNHVVQGKDIIFHLAGQVCHILSLSDPFPDIEYNIKGTLILLEAVRKYNPQAKIVYTGTRGEYGEVQSLPAKEDEAMNPKGLYELTNLTAAKMFLLYYNNHGVKSVVTRLTNIYGPRSQMKTHKYGVVNWFCRLAIDNQEIQVFGDGKGKRDLVYVDDVVDALCLLAQNENCFGQVFNIGNDKYFTFIEIVENIIKVAGAGSYKFAEFSEERKKMEPGDFYSDISKIKKYTGWTPQTALADGLTKCIQYYKQNKRYYW